MRGLWRYAHRMVPHLDFVQQGYRYWQEIKAAGVPFLPGHVIRRAIGSEVITSAMVSPCDDEWRRSATRAALRRRRARSSATASSPRSSSAASPAASTCTSRRGGYVPVRNRELESTVPGVFIVGDGAGVAGSAVALEEGHLAGLAVANRQGRSWAATTRARPTARAAGCCIWPDFRRVMDDLYRFGPGLYALAGRDHALPLRGNEAAEALGAVRDGCRHVNEVKAWTRVGMGRCQGRCAAPPSPI